MLVLFETVLLLLLLRALGEIRQQGTLSTSQTRTPELGRLKVGEPAPALVGRDQNGKEIRLSNFLGKRCLLAFISAKCSACAGAIETLVSIQEETPDIATVFVAGPDFEANCAYALQHDLHLPVLTSEPGFAQRVYDVRMVPLLFVLDEHGIIRAKEAAIQREHVKYVLQTADLATVS